MMGIIIKFLSLNVAFDIIRLEFNVDDFLFFFFYEDLK